MFGETAAGVTLGALRAAVGDRPLGAHDRVVALDHRHRAEDADAVDVRASAESPTDVDELLEQLKSRSERAERIACLPGDGIGPEVIAQALRVLAMLPLDVEVVELPFGGAAIDAVGDPLPADTLAACRDADAVLLGAVGGPRWDGGAVRPEAGLLGLRRALDVYANLRPAVRGDIDLSSCASSSAASTSVSGACATTAPCSTRASTTRRRSSGWRAARSSSPGRGAAALSRSTRRTCSRRLASGVASSASLRRTIPDVELRHALVDSFAIEVALAPETLDVVVTENMFGDILSDLAAGRCRRARPRRVREPRRRRPRHLRAGPRLRTRHRRHGHRRTRRR